MNIHLARALLLMAFVGFPAFAELMGRIERSRNPIWVAILMLSFLLLSVALATVLHDMGVPNVPAA